MIVICHPKLYSLIFIRPEEADQASFSCRERRGGAVLSLPVEAQRQDTRARGDFGKWMLKRIDRWFAFAKGLGLGINQMEEIILVTGCDTTRSWANVTFLEGRMNGQASFGVRVDQARDININWQFSPGKIQGAVCNWGPEGKVCPFVRDNHFWDTETTLSQTFPPQEPTGGPMYIHQRISRCSCPRHITEAAQRGGRTKPRFRRGS